MMSLSQGALNAAQAENYFEEHYSHDDYYSENHCTVGQWVGKGAVDLGLVGEVSREHFSAMLQGVHPTSNAILVPAATHNGDHDAGWDSVFSAPKSISIQALVGGDHRLIEAHTQAVQRTIGEIEAFALASQKGGSELVVSGNITGAAFTHLAARPSLKSERPDPQLHTHVVLLNVTRRPDGEWRGLRPIEIYRSQQYGSAIYRAELAREVQSLGYRIEVVAPNGAWELQGYSREQIEVFSQRRQDIEEVMAEKRVNDPRARQMIALQTRQSKGDIDPDVLKAEWQQRAVDNGIDTLQIRREARHRLGTVPADSRLAAAEAVSFAAAHTTEREAVADRRELEQAALVHGMGRTHLDGVRGQIIHQEGVRRLIPTHQRDWKHPQGQFTTDAMLALERDNLALVRGGINVAEPIADQATVRQWSAARGLFADQTKAVELTITSRDWITAIEGLAGTTKTTTVGAIREFAEGEDYTVRGFGMTSGSVKALAGAGINSRTIASLVENALPSRAAKELWIVDESSLLDSRKANQVLTAAKRHADRIVFVGDQKQHHAIEAGAPVRQLLADNMAVVELTTIRRQRDPELKQAVQFAAEGQTKQALEMLEQQGRITVIPEAAKRYERIAQDYVQAHEAGQRTLVVSPANDERRALNEKIRTMLVDRGHIAGEGRDHLIFVRHDLTRAQKNHARNYEPGDLLEFRRESKRYGVGKGEYARVESVNVKGNALQIQRADGQRVPFHPRNLQGFEVYRPEERTLAIGDRIQFRAPDKALKVANGEFANVVGLNAQNATLQLDSGREVKAGFNRLRHIDYGYASTSHAAQGATVDRVIVNVDSMRSAQLVNQKQFYVSISRAREDARIYTDGAEALRWAVARKPEKSIALEMVKTRKTEELSQAEQPTMRLGI